MSWVTAQEYRAASADPLADVADGIISDINEDHADTNLLYVQALAGLEDASEAALVGLDCYGMTLSADTPAGPRLARVAFPDVLRTVEQVRRAFLERLDAARLALRLSSCNRVKPK